MTPRRTRNRNSSRAAAVQQSNEVLARQGCFVKECCDQCSQLLGPVRFTRRADTGVWCSRECRGDGDRRMIRKGGRPISSKERAPDAKPDDGKTHRGRKPFGLKVQRNGKPSRRLTEIKDLQAQKTQALTLSHYPIFSGRKTGFPEGGAPTDKRWRRYS